MRRLTATTALAALLLAGCASTGQQESVGPFGRMKQAWGSLLHPVVRQAASYLVCATEDRAEGLVLTLARLGVGAVVCSSQATVPHRTLPLRTVSKIEPGAVIELEEEPMSMSAAEFSRQNASAPPRIGPLRVVRGAPKRATRGRWARWPRGPCPSVLPMEQATGEPLPGLL